MKKSELKKIIKEEIKHVIKEYNIRREINFTRKPTSFDKIKEVDYNNLSSKAQEFIKSLPEVDLGELEEPEDIFVAGIEEEPQYSVLYKTNNQKDIEVYLCNTEGYDYPRYMIKLNNYTI